jgi:hypothetical protein
MSAYTLPDSGFQQLASELFARICNQNHKFCYELCHLTKANRIDTDERIFQRCVATVEDLRKANYDAVNERYAHLGEPEEIYPITYRNSYFQKWDDFQLIKSLICLRYQMSEGKVFESEIYKRFDKSIGNLAVILLDEWPEFNDSTWGFPEVKRQAQEAR